MSIPRILTSSKFQASAFATALIAVPLIFTLTDKAVSRPEKQSATEKFIIATAGVWGIAVAGTALEDYSKNRDKPAGVGSGQPVQQFNIGPDATNTQQGGAPATLPIATTSQSPSVGTFTPSIDPAPLPMWDETRTSSPAPPPKKT